MTESVAIAHDDFMQYGGAEKLVAAMADIFPNAPIFTSLYNPEVLEKLGISRERVHASFMQKIPFKKSLHKALFFLYPFAFEHISSQGQLDRYKVVISSTARFAHGVLTKPGTFHIAYVNSPGRFWWEPQKYTRTRGMFFKSIILPVLNWLKEWDKIAMARVDYIVANSKNVGGKFEKCYGRKADKVVYPFYQKISGFRLQDQISKVLCATESSQVSHQFLIVTRLVKWKRVDIAVEAFKRNPELGNLIIIGRGPEERRLKRLARGAKNVSFLSGLTDDELHSYYSDCTALIVTQEEDFGITPLEAMAQGKPVIAFEKGGVLETCDEYGFYFKKQTAESLEQAVEKFKKSEAPERRALIRQAEKFSKERFDKELLFLVSSNDKA